MNINIYYSMVRKPFLGPFNHETTLLFWEMVWQSNCSKIIMLTNTREQHRTLCVEYWPENEDRIGRIKIKLEKYRRLPLIIIRTFVLQKGNELRKIKHYQFTGWLQKSGPSNANAFLQLYNLTQGREEDTRLIIVHCSAGIGRTGTYIAFDCLMDEANETGQLSVVNCILKLRQQRPLMVQTSDTYMRDRLFTIQGETFDTMYKIGYKRLILYLVILCLKNILCVNYKNETQPSVAYGSSFSKALSQNLLRGEVVIIIGAIIWLLLLGTMAVGVKRTHCLQGLFSSRKSKRDLYQVIELQESRENFENEINEIYEQILPHVNTIKGSFPVDVFVKMVKKTTSSDLKSEFKEIPSAVTNACQHAYLEENRRKNRYKRICPYDYNRVKLSMTDMPDYTDYINASYIHGFKNENKFIAAQGPFNHETTLLFWEMVWQSDCSAIVMFTNTREQHRTRCGEYWPENEERIGRIKIKSIKCSRSAFIIARTFVLEKSDETHHVKHYQFTGWVQKESHSVSNAFLQLYNLTHSKEESSPIIVHCSSGIGRTGTYIAFDHLMDEAHETGQLSVQDCIMKLRNQRPLMVQTSDDYQFLLRMLAGNITHVYDEAVTLDL